ncbi:T6SS phospholipase effector Tle1-like catalytic domain-containing protein [Flavobacterium hercynium]|uniref:T6SS Phospholipase effector Tle1-like catalytic domain-containing protein n=1 Tax=Flavobacterium hercynium TaxID=387094 RepID=A0A226GPH4_9FLAO|nr:DUF2235 domain-containing protein [Flavobacterium hercynium]OXA83306.1 hypothetical protein B0A66_22380 [Flavobacterium hercynium]SMP15013.1 Uncharacterized alpha/beta hydrolase domain [Flavobacterium hercynium]
MGKSFVYNVGSALENKKDDELWFDYGVFIDGTLNNNENTRLRRKYRNEDERSILTKDKKEKDLEREKEDYESLTKDGLIRIPDGVDISKFNSKEYKDYLLGIYRTDMDKLGTDNSYSNDDTNVTRMWNCCKKDYKIYIEGMGTSVSDGTIEDRKDSQDGFAFGAGQTGIRRRVRLACERIAEKILDRKKIDKNYKVTQITLDVFGFSRGAASARNFVHEVNAKKPYKPQEIKIPDGYETYYVRGEPRTKKKYRKAIGDADGLEINTKRLINGKMPRLGHLGYSLLEKGAVTKEELEYVKIIIRFIGVYDTVSSYYEMGALGAYDENGKAQDDPSFIKLASEALSTNFTNDEEELGLQDLGDVSQFEKLVHFTAKDEHRRNFALTRINQIPKKAIEKNFPGVHCDIGGAYENEEEEYIDEIGTSLMDSYYSYNNHKKALKPDEKLPMPPIGLEALKEDLIDQYWYSKEQLKILKEYHGFKFIFGKRIELPLYLKLTGTRVIRKEYSYIPLHFMEDFCRGTTMSQFFNRKTVEDYPLNNPFLEKVKSSLHDYVFENSPEWEFVSDADLVKEKEEREKISQETEGKQQEGIAITDSEEVDICVDLPEIKINSLNTQKALRKLRREYIHWSSTRDWFGMEPADNRIRVCYPKK